MLKKEIADNLKLYQKVEDMAEYIPLELLPSNYPGGKEDSIDNLWGKNSIEIQINDATFFSNTEKKTSGDVWYFIINSVFFYFQLNI